MATGTIPHIGVAIKTVRRAKKLSQEGLAQIAFTNRAVIGAIEQGKTDCPTELLYAFKKAMDIEHLPMTPAERPAYVELLNKWYSAISERDNDGAKKLHKQLSVIKLLPYDTELNSFFDMYECRMQILLNDFEPAAKTLNDYARILDTIDAIQRYHYYYNQGTLNLKQGFNENALDFYKKAYDMTAHGIEKSVALNFNLALTYERLGFFARSATYLEEALTLDTIEKGSVMELLLCNLLGMNYAFTGVLQRAKFFLDKAYKIAVNNDSKEYLGMVCINYGLLFRNAKKWNNALEYLEQALLYLEDGTENFFKANYNKILCMIGRRGYHFYSGELANMISRTKGNKDFTMLFASLEYMATLGSDSAKCLEKEVLPYLMEKNYVHAALDCCTVLMEFYKKQKKGRKTKAFEMATIGLTIQTKMHEGEVIV